MAAWLAAEPLTALVTIFRAKVADTIFSPRFDWRLAEKRGGVTGSRANASAAIC